MSLYRHVYRNMENTWIAHNTKKNSHKTNIIEYEKNRKDSIIRGTYENLSMRRKLERAPSPKSLILFRRDFRENCQRYGTRRRKSGLGLFCEKTHLFFPVTMSIFRRRLIESQFVTPLNNVPLEGTPRPPNLFKTF